MLFGIDAAADADAEATIRAFWREFEADPEGRAYADSLVRGVAGNLERVDELIRTSSTNWRLERMARVDRNLLRMAAYELLEQKSVPRAVILDEAIELAKLFGSEDSGAFVNGVLDRIAEEVGRIDVDR
jgi:N utilization substance protein B